MAFQMDEEHEMTWLVEDEGEGTENPASQQPESAEDQVIQYTMELQRIRKELADVRKELAAKTVQLMRKEQAAAVEKAEKPQAESQPAAVSQETERQLQLLTGQTIQLEALLSQREEELAEAKRLLVTQKRALREAAALQGEREAADRAAAEASRAVVGQAVEEELERLHAELAAAKTRSDLELRKRESELKQLRRELAAVNHEHKQALSAQESNLAEAWQAEMARVQASLGQRVSEYETEVARLRMQLQEAESAADSTSLLGELAMLNNNKIQVQREFEAFKEMATQATRKNREEVARLLEENAALHSRLANLKTAELTGAGMNLMRPMHSGRTKTVDMSSDQPPPGVSGYSAYAYQAMEAYMPQLLRRMERNQKGLVPMLIIGSVLMLMLMVAVVRAAASTHSQHSGALCFLAKLGISIGKGCGPTALQQRDATQQITDLLDRPKRHHDVDVDTISDLPDGQGLMGIAATPPQAVTETQAAANITDSVHGSSTNTTAGGEAVGPGGGMAEGQSSTAAGGAESQVVPAGVTGTDAVPSEATVTATKAGRKRAGRGAAQGSIVVTPAAAAAGTDTPVVAANQSATAMLARSIKLGGRRRGE